MQPDALHGLLARGSIEAFLPEALKALAGGNAPAKRLDPLRDGAVTILPLAGPLSPKGSYGGTSTERFADQVREAGADKRVGAIVLDVASYGGMLFGTAEAADAVYAVRQVKPVVAVANPMAMSAAHWIALQASAFYASTSGQVGSAGISTGHVDRSGLDAKLGLKTTLIASSKEKIARHPHAPLSNDDRAEMLAEVQEANHAFIAAIARGRGIAPGQVPALHGTGQTFSAAKAAQRGMIDGVLTLPQAVALAGSAPARLALIQRRAAARASFSTL